MHIYGYYARQLTAQRGHPLLQQVPTLCTCAVTARDYRSYACRRIQMQLWHANGALIIMQHSFYLSCPSVSDAFITKLLA